MARILITGASDGIGKATASVLAAQGHDLLLHGRDVRKLESIARTLKDKYGAAASVFTCDLTSLHETALFAKEVLGKYSSLDVLINNAGGLFPTFEMTPEGLEKNVALHHVAPFLLSRMLLPSLERSSKPRIISTSSLLYRRCRVTPQLENLNVGQPYQMMQAYAWSKALHLVLIASPYFLPKNSRVAGKAVHPGMLNTNLARELRGVKKSLFVVLRPLLFGAPESGGRLLATLAVEESETTQVLHSSKGPRPLEAWVLNEETQKAVYAATLRVVESEVVSNT